MSSGSFASTRSALTPVRICSLSVFFLFPILNYLRTQASSLMELGLFGARLKERRRFNFNKFRFCPGGKTYSLCTRNLPEGFAMVQQEIMSTMPLPTEATTKDSSNWDNFERSRQLSVESTGDADQAAAKQVIKLANSAKQQKSSPFKKGLLPKKPSKQGYRFCLRLDGFRRETRNWRTKRDCKNWEAAFEQLMGRTSSLQFHSRRPLMVGPPWASATRDAFLKGDAVQVQPETYDSDEEKGKGALNSDTVQGSFLGQGMKEAAYNYFYGMAQNYRPHAEALVDVGADIGYTIVSSI